MTRPSSDPSDELLVLAPDIVLRLAGGGQVEISVGGRRHVAGVRVLSILEYFARPTSMGEFVRQLSAAGVEDFIDATSLVTRLREEGVLVDPGQRGPGSATGFDTPWAHVAMLDDLTRTRAFVRAVRDTVRPNDVVLDIGAGTGVLSVVAAQAGARRVYAIEEGGIAEAAEHVFAANGVSDRVTLVRGRSTRVELPERADVLVSEVLGNDPFAEHIVAIFRDAHRRLLQPRARVVPRSVDVFALPVDLPDEFLDERTFTDRNVSRWRDTHGVEFQPLKEYAAGVLNLPNVRPQDARHWRAIADPVHLVRVDLARLDDVALTTTAAFVARARAQSLGFFLYFESELTSEVVLSTAPSAASDSNCWTGRVCRASERARVEAGESVRIEFSAASGQSVLRAT